MVMTQDQTTGLHFAQLPGQRAMGDARQFAVTDASGTFSPEIRHAAWSRMSQAGVQLMNWFSVACELHRDWRNDIEGLGAMLSRYIPNHGNLMTSYFYRTNIK